MATLAGKVLVFIPLVLTCWIFQVLSNRMAVNNINCTCQAPICSGVNSSFTRLELHTYSLSLGGFIAQPPSKIYLRVRRQVKKGRGWTPTNIDLSFDFCQFFNGLKVPLIDVFAPGLRQLADATFQSCPFRGGFYIQNFTASTQNFPTNSPVGKQFKTDVIFCNEKLMAFFSCYVFSKVHSE